MFSELSIRARLRAGAIHLVLSCGIAAIAAALVFLLWYPERYKDLSGGRSLFFLVVAVDVVIGPLLTVAVFDLAKGWSHLRRDLAVIALLQLGALAYGLHTVYIVRPIALVFERDRFRIVSAADVYVKELEVAPQQYRRLPLAGPWTLGTRPTLPAEREETIFLSLQGYDVGQRPIFWQPYEESRKDAVKRARPISLLLERNSDRRADLDKAVADTGLRFENAYFLPLMARVDAVVIVDEVGQIAGFAPFDGFF
jgi:hypothetical protein